MTTVYIAGPVVRYDSPFETQEERALIYDRIRKTLLAAGMKVIVPVADKTTENADPQTFFQTMRDRIAESDLVITVFPERNRSVPVESTIASVMNKAQYVIAGEIDAVPRILKGLPGVILVAPADDLNQVLHEIQYPDVIPPSKASWGNVPLVEHDYTQTAINSGQRRINYELTRVDHKLVEAVAALTEALAKTPGLSRIDFDEARAAIKEAYETSERLADIGPPGSEEPMGQ